MNTLPTGSVSLVVLLAAALATTTCGQIEEAPTAPSTVPSRSNPPTSPAPAPAPAPSPTTPAPAPPAPTAAGRIQITINPNPVPFSGQPITDIASCRDRPNTWFYDQVLRETGGVAVTVTERVDSFDGAAGSRSNPGLRVPANGSLTVRTRWCSATAAAHTAQTNFSGTDANGRSWNTGGPVVRLMAR